PLSGVYTLSLHDALPIFQERRPEGGAVLLGDLLPGGVEDGQLLLREVVLEDLVHLLDGVVELLRVGAPALQQRQQRLVDLGVLLDRKSTRLNSSHVSISY